MEQAREHLKRLHDDLVAGFESLARELGETTTELERERRAREHAQSAAQRSRSLFARAFNSTSDYFTISRLSDGTYLEVNDSFVEMSGYGRDEIMGSSALDLGVWADATGRTALRKSLEETGRIRDLEMRFRTRSGEIRHLRLSADLIDIDGEACIFARARDVTERREADAIRSELAAIVEGSEDAIYARTADGIITSWNAATEALYGYSGAEAIGRSIDFLVPKHREGEDRALVERVLAGERIRAHETERLRKDGELVDVALSISPIRERDGSMVGFASIARDVTERVRARDALQRAYEREREVAERLRLLDEAKNGLLTAVSHDMRSSLTGILGFARLLEDQFTNLSGPHKLRMLGIITESAKRLERLLSNLLDLDRLRRGLVEAQREPTDLAELVRSVVSTCDVGKTHRVSLKALSLVLNVDPAKVERIVENLVVNAMRHTPKGTQIWIRIEARDDGALLAVEDGGGGIPHERHTEIFHAFERGAEGDGSPGTGAGLAVVRRFAELHGGRAWVEDRPGGGAAFFVYLPDEPMSA